MKIKGPEGITEISVKELDGTDLGAVREFVQRHREIRGAILIYQDDEGINAVRWERKGCAKLRNLWKPLRRLLDRHQR